MYTVNMHPSAFPSEEFFKLYSFVNNNKKKNLKDNSVREKNKLKQKTYIYTT